MMRIGTAVNKQLDALARLKDAYGAARSFGSSHTELMARTAPIYADLAKCPRHVRDYVRGYDHCLRDQLYRHDLIWGAYINGEFYSHDRERADSVDARGIDYRAFTDLLKTPGAVTGHYWKHNVKRAFSEGPPDGV